MSAFQPVAPNGKDPKKAKKETAKPEVPEASMRDSLRKVIGSDEKSLAFILQALKEACEPSVKVRITDQPCPKCSCPHTRYVLVARHKEAVDLYIKLMEQVEGKPGTAEAGSQGIVVNWGIVGVDE